MRSRVGVLRVVSVSMHGLSTSEMKIKNNNTVNTMRDRDKKNNMVTGAQKRHHETPSRRRQQLAATISKGLKVMQCPKT